jgi:hypothetical protein
VCCDVLCCSGLPDSSVVKGMVLRRDTEGTVKMVKDAKVAVFAQVCNTTCRLHVDFLSRSYRCMVALLLAPPAATSAAYCSVALLQ